MIRKEQPLQPLPEYHDQLLILRLRPDAVAAVAAAVAPMMAVATAAVGHAALAEPAIETAATAAIGPAMSALMRGGMIRRVTPLARRATAGFSGPLASFAALASATSKSLGERVLSGTTIIELERGVSVGDARKQLSDDPQVQYVARVPLRYALAVTSQKAAPPQTALWNLRKVEWAKARKLPKFKDADKVKVAVLDTGIDRKHPDLKKQTTAYVYEHPDDPLVSGEKDLVGHGTHVSGTIAATIGNAVGIDGICRCDLRAWKIFTDQPLYIPSFGEFIYVVDTVMYQRALADCLDDGIDVINLSIGGPAPPDPQEQQLFNALIAAGTTICAAMGNERSIGSPTSYPAAIEGVIAVGATNINDAVANFSNTGDHITLAAPGKGIWSTLPTYEGQSGFEAEFGPDGSPHEGKPLRREKNYDSWDGTSMATPHVTAAAALHVAKNGRTDGATVKAALKKSADKVPGMGGKAFHPDYGAGRLNLLKLLK